MDSPYNKELTLAFSAVQAAASISQSMVQSKDKGDVEKDDLSPVTIADFAVQALLVATFKAAFPRDNFVGEENASLLRSNKSLLQRVWGLLKDLKARGLPTGCKIPASKDELCDLVDQCGTSIPGGEGSGRTWVFDPIDGTRTYILGQVYAINVAMLVDGKQTVGVVGCPNTSMDAKAPMSNADIDPSSGGCILYTARGHGTYVRPLPGSIAEVSVRRLEVSAITSLKDVRFVTANTIIDSGIDGIHEIVAQRMGVSFPGCDLLPWVLRWAMLALGLGNTTIWVYKNRRRLGKVWDHAGAMLLFEEAGGKITDVFGNDMDLTAGRKMKANFSFVAAPAGIHNQVLELVQNVLRDEGKGDLLK